MARTTGKMHTVKVEEVEILHCDGCNNQIFLRDAPENKWHTFGYYTSDERDGHDKPVVVNVSRDFCSILCQLLWIHKNLSKSYYRQIPPAVRKMQEEWGID